MVGAHTGTITYEPLYGGTWTVAKFNEAMAQVTDRYFYLVGNVRVEGNIQVSYITRLCLNGYSMTGVNFSSNENMGICNCKTATSTISNDGTYRFKEGYLYIYGNNKNIEIKTDYLSKLEPYAEGGGSAEYIYREMGLYDLTVKPYSDAQTDKNIINSTGAAFAFIEKVDIQDIKAKRFINEAAGILKDVNVSNCVFTSHFIYSYYNHPTSNLAYKSHNIGNPSLSGNINVSSVTMASLLGIRGLDLTVDGIVNVENSTFTGQGIFDTGIASFRWQTSPSSYGYLNFAASVTLVKDGSVNISNNIINKYNGVMYIFRVGSENAQGGEAKSLDLALLGDFIFTNNKYVGVTAESSNYISGIYMRDSTQRVTIGSNKILFENNTTDATDEAKTSNPLYTNFIPVVALTTDVIFDRESDSTILSNESRMQVLFANAAGKGNIVSNWEGLNGTDYRTIFTAATYSELRKYAKIYHDTSLVYIDFHPHTLCGVTGECTHTLGVSHNKEIVEYEPLPKGLSMSQVNAYLNGTQGGLSNNIFLTEDITLDGYNINYRRDLNICLNGFSIEGGFRNSGSYKLTITNCKENISHINTNIYVDYSFDLNSFDIYGKEVNGNKNIDITASRYIDYSSSARNDKTAYIYNATFTKYQASGQNNVAAVRIEGSSYVKTITFDQVIFVGSDNVDYRNSHLFEIYSSSTNNIINLKDVTIKNYKSLTYGIALIGNGTLNMYGTNTIDGIENYQANTYQAMFRVISGNFNIHEGTLNIINNKVRAKAVMLIEQSATVNVDKGATINVIGNKFYGVDADQQIISTKESNMLGNINVIGNKFIQTGPSAYSKSAFYISGTGTLSVGTGSIVVKDNDVYTEEDEDVLNTEQHAYGLYSELTDNATPVFTQSVGKFSKDSYIERIKFAHASGYGILMKDWKENAEDPNNYESQFVVDTYTRKSLKTLINGDDLVINDAYYVEFMYDEKTYTKIATQTIIVNGKATQSEIPEDPKNLGRMFLGWATKSNAKKKDSFALDTFVVTKDVKLFAVFSGIPPKVGDTFLYGTYPQSSTDYEVIDPIKWKVIRVDENEGRALVVADQHQQLGMHLL